MWCVDHRTYTPDVDISRSRITSRFTDHMKDKKRQTNRHDDTQDDIRVNNTKRSFVVCRFIQFVYWLVTVSWVFVCVLNVTTHELQQTTETTVHSHQCSPTALHSQVALSSLVANSDLASVESAAYIIGPIRRGNPSRGTRSPIFLYC